MIEFYTVGILIAALLNTYFGFLVYLKNRKALLNKLYGLLCLAFGIWSYSWFVLLLLRDKNIFLSIFLARLLNFGAIWIPIFYFHWLCVFLRIIEKNKKFIIFGYLLSSIFSLICWTPFYIKGTHSILIFPHWPTAGYLYKFYLIFGYSFFVFYGLFLLFTHLVKSSGIQKKQIMYVILGSILGFIPGAANFPLMYQIIPFGNFTLLLMFLFLAFFIPFSFPLSYAVIKYRLMDVKIIFTELLVGTIGIILFLQIIFAQNLQWRISSFSVFLLFLIFAYYLVKSVHEEERRREEAERLAQKERELREQAEKLAKEWQMLAQSKDQFIISIQHHFRTPLSIFKGYLSNILEGIWGPVPPEILNKLNNVLFSANDLTRLIESLLEVQQFKLGKGFLLISKEDISEVLKETIEELKPEIERKKISLNLNIFPLIFEFDKKRIKEVFFNILNNAIKYSFPQGKITISLYQEKDSPLPIRISFQDEGKGMEKEEIETLKKGELFFRTKESSSFDATGKGIGLAIS